MSNSLEEELGPINLAQFLERILLPYREAPWVSRQISKPEILSGNSKQTSITGRQCIFFYIVTDTVATKFIGENCAIKLPKHKFTMLQVSL